MSASRWLIPPLIVLTLAGWIASTEAVDSRLATLILTGGTILTLEPREPDPAPTTVAIAGDRILYVGDETGAREFAGPETPTECGAACSVRRNG